VENKGVRKKMKSFLFTLVTVAWATVSAATAQTIYTGHWDISAHEHLHGGNTDLEIALHNHDAGTEYELPDPGVQFQIGFGNANGTAPAPKQSVTIGSTLLGNVWVTAHDEADAELLNQPFIGFSAQELTLATFDGSQNLLTPGWSGDVTFTLTSLRHNNGNGTGKLFLFEGEDLYWNSTALVGGNYGVFTVAADSHGHGEFAFSDEGLYELTLVVSGTHSSGTITSSPTTLNINVVPEPSSGALLLAGMAALAVTRRKIRRSI
jgi:surface-anchored protein